MLDDKDHREFVRLITQNQRPLYRYIFSLVPNWNDADEVLQETHLRLWEEFEKFEEGTNFGAWARTIAYYQMLTWRKKASRNKLLFDQDLIDQLSARLEEVDEQADHRRLALADCIGELSSRNRDLLSRCYAEGARIRDVALVLDRTSAAVYKSIQRLRLALHECIQRRLGESQLEEGNF